MDEPVVKQSFQRATRRSSEQRRDCPEASELSRLAAGKLDEPTRAALVDHVTGCSSCAMEVRLARSLLEWAEGKEEPESAVPDRRFWRPPTWAVVTAALLLLGVGVLLFVRLEPRTPSTQRQGSQDELHSLVDESEPLPRDELVLRWSHDGGDVTYDLRVVNEELEVLYEARGLRRAEHRVPASALENVPSGARILWQVDIAGADGSGESSRTFFATLE